MFPSRMHRLALVMIVRDEARCLERCLASARPWVDDMLVLDTGSVDASAAIAGARAPASTRFEWIDDFAAARNAALAHSRGRLEPGARCRRMDPDGGGALAALRTRNADYVGQVSVVSAFDAAGGRVTEAPSWLPRVLPHGVRYEGRIHEQPTRRCHVGGWRSTSGTTATATRRRRPRQAATSVCCGSRSRPARGCLLDYQLGKDHELQARSARPRRTMPRRARATRRPRGATTWSCAGSSR